MNETPTYSVAPPRGWRTVLLRLWLLRPVKSLPADDPVLAILVMGALWICAWIAIDRWQSQPQPQFLADGIPLLAWYVLAILGLAAVLRWRVRPEPPFSAVLALAMGAVPMPLLFTGVAALLLASPWLLAGSALVGIYTLLYLAHGLRELTGNTQRTAAVAGLVFIAAFGWLTDRLNVIPDVWSPLELQAVETDEGLADSEAILFDQSGRIDRALQAVARSSSPKPQAFFLGFAGVGDQKVFAQEIGLAAGVLGARYDIASRGVSLINDQRDLQRFPLATVSGLKYALRGLGSRMDPERDVLFLSLSSHGSDEPAIAVSNSELPLMDLTDEDLADALRGSGIKWRVIIISACYAGGFIDALRDPQTIVIAASAADRTSFGCSNDRDLTYFGEAFYRDALPTARSLRDAFEKAKTSIAARERRERIAPSSPQAFFGTKMEAKLDAMHAGQP